MKYYARKNYNKIYRNKLFDFVSDKLTIYSLLLLSLWFNQAEAIINIHVDKPYLFLNNDYNPTVMVHLVDNKQSDNDSHIIFLLQEKYKYLLPKSCQWIILNEAGVVQTTINIKTGNPCKRWVSVKYETTINLSDEECDSYYLLELINMLTLVNAHNTIMRPLITDDIEKESSVNKGVTLLEVDCMDGSVKTKNKMLYFYRMLEAMKYLEFHNIDCMKDIVNECASDGSPSNLTDRESYLTDQSRISFPVVGFGHSDCKKFILAAKEVTYFLFKEYCLPETHEELRNIFSDPLTKNIIKHSVYFIDAIIPWAQSKQDKYDIVSRFTPAMERCRESGSFINYVIDQKFESLNVFESESERGSEGQHDTASTVEIMLSELRYQTDLFKNIAVKSNERCIDNTSKLELLYDYSIMHLTLQLRWEQISILQPSEFLIPDMFKTIFPFIQEVRSMVQEKMTSNDFFDGKYTEEKASTLINIAKDWDDIVPKVGFLECDYNTDMVIGLRQLTLLMALKSCGSLLHFSSKTFNLKDYMKSENKCGLLARQMICPMIKSDSMLFMDEDEYSYYNFECGIGREYDSLYTVPLEKSNYDIYKFKMSPVQQGDNWYSNMEEDCITSVSLTDISCNVIRSYVKLVEDIFSLVCFRDNFIPLIYEKHSKWIDKISEAPK